jgi:hypothetical protein
MKARVLAGLAVLTAAACGATTPTQPDSVTLRALAITGMPSSFWADERVALAAQATYSDGRTETATGRVRWATRTLACLVDGAGMLTGASEGDCTVEASLDGVTATAAVRVGAARFFSVTGRVREEFGVGQPAMARVSVVVVNGPKAGHRVETDAAGMFTISDVPREVVQLRVEADDYAPLTLSVAPGDPPQDVLVSPVISIDERSFPESGSDLWREVQISFTVRHRGPFVLRLTANQQQCEVSYHTVFSATLLRTGVQLAWVCPDWNRSGTEPPALGEDRRILEPGDYIIRVGYSPWLFGSNRRMYLSYPR